MRCVAVGQITVITFVAVQVTGYIDEAMLKVSARCVEVDLHQQLATTYIKHSKKCRRKARPRTPSRPIERHGIVEPSSPGIVPQTLKSSGLNVRFPSSARNKAQQCIISSDFFLSPSNDFPILR